MFIEGNAYADDTEQETVRDGRMSGIASKRIDSLTEDNLANFEEMKAGSEDNIKRCIRAKLPADSPNKAVRDTVIYRCNPTRYHHTGTKWKVYLTYDCRCPIVDSMEGVIQAFKTTEYTNRNPQYHWMLDALNLRKVHIREFTRVIFVRTLLSRHKLTENVDQGIVWELDDLRFPTIRRIRRRGMTVELLREFILRQGPSRIVVNLDWILFEVSNRNIDPITPRHAAVPDIDVVTTRGEDAQAGAYTENELK